MNLKVILRFTRLIALVIIALDTIGIVFVLTDILFLHEFGYPWWSVAVLVFGIGFCWFYRAATGAWMRDHGY